MILTDSMRNELLERGLISDSLARAADRSQDVANRLAQMWHDHCGDPEHVLTADERIAYAERLVEHTEWLADWYAAREEVRS